MSRQPVVRRNDWSTLDVPEVGAWTPTRSVSVVVPAWRAERSLPFVLAALAAQTYPAHLLEVVVVDDGNDPPVSLPDLRPEHTRVVRVEDGWGQSNALRTAILTCDTDVIHRLDADMLAYREHVETQLRWHHVIDYAVVLGTKRFVDPAPLLERSPAEVRDAVAAGEADSLFALEESEAHDWVEKMWRRTGDLTEAGTRGFRAHVGATGSMTRSLYDAAGGFDPALVLGEDIELGYRLGEAGGVLIPEHGARAWHLGSSAVMQQREAINRHNDAAIANLIPGMRPKRNRRGRLYERPYLEVVIPGDGDADDVIGCVDAILDSDFDDLRVVLLGEWDQLDDARRSVLADPLLDRRIVERTYRADVRVTLATGLSQGRCGAPFRLTLDGTALAPVEPALRALLEDVERTHEGARVIEGVGTLRRTAAVSRALRIGGLDEVDDLIAEAWGTQVLTAAEAGWVPTPEREVPRAEGKLRKPIDPARSRAIMAATLGRRPAVAASTGVEAAESPDDSHDDHRKRGIFGRRR